MAELSNLEVFLLLNKLISKSFKGKACFYTLKPRGGRPKLSLIQNVEGKKVRRLSLVIFFTCEPSCLSAFPLEGIDSQEKRDKASQIAVLRMVNQYKTSKTQNSSRIFQSNMWPVGQISRIKGSARHMRSGKENPRSILKVNSNNSMNGKRKKK